jgi:hypothetical protein
MRSAFVESQGCHQPRPRERTRAPATSRLPANGLSSPEASGRSGLLMRSISMSSSWLRPVMYTFMSSAAGKAYSTPWSSGSDSAAPAGAAYNVSAGMHTAEPSIVCGREKRQSTCSSDDGRGSATAMSAGSGSLSSSLCWARALRGGLATATLRRQRGARVGRAAEVAEPVDSAWTRTPDSRSADNTKRADISAADAEMKVHTVQFLKGMWGNRHKDALLVRRTSLRCGDQTCYMYSL